MPVEVDFEFDIEDFTSGEVVDFTPLQLNCVNDDDVFYPFQNKAIQVYESPDGWHWADSQHTVPYARYRVKCKKCNERTTFRINVPEEEA